MKAFVDGKARFISHFAREQTFPLGPPQRQVVNGVVVMIPTPLVEFEAHRYQTDDARTAKGMFEDKMIFDRPKGFSLDASCLPLAFREFWPHMSTETRRKVGVAFAEGKSEEEAFELVPGNETRAKAKSEDPGDAYQLGCNEKGCKFVAKGDKAQQTLAAHMLVAHGGKLAAAG